MPYKEVELLLAQNYSFDYFCAKPDGRCRIRFHNRDEKENCKILCFTNEKIYEEDNSPETPTSYMDTRKYFVDKHASRHFIEFVLEYSKKGLVELYIYLGWAGREEIWINFKDGLFRVLEYGDFEMRAHENSAELARTVFPDVIAPVSEIIREYAEYSLYDFLAEYSLYSFLSGRIRVRARKN